MIDPIDDPFLIRRAGAVDLARALTAGRDQSLRLFECTRAALGGQLDIAYSENVNLPLWELGHLGWFEEFWIARNTERLSGQAARFEAPRAAPLLPNADAFYDSSAVVHAQRWQLNLPDTKRTLAMLFHGRERTLRLLHDSPADDNALYFFRLAVMHEAMHGEAGAMIAQALGLDIGNRLPVSEPAAAPHADDSADVLAVPARTATFGASGRGFVFDNELGEHAVDVAAFEIDSAPVTWGAYLPFIEAGGYDNARHWSAPGWAWRMRELSSGLPRYIERGDGGQWRRECFGRLVNVDQAQPAVHLSLHEAQAWCAWAGRRLPTEHEWTIAREDHGDAFAWGQVWEWTATPFSPWPGFAPHPYRDYSQPWFDGRPVLKGGSFATAPCIKHPGYRNFFTAGRNDAFAGFRSCGS